MNYLKALKKVWKRSGICSYFIPVKTITASKYPIKCLLSPCSYSTFTLNHSAFRAHHCHCQIYAIANVVKIGREKAKITTVMVTVMGRGFRVTSEGRGRFRQSPESKLLSNFASLPQLKTPDFNLYIIQRIIS